MSILLNPVFVSVVLMLTLCVLRVNVYLSIIIAALVCGLMGGAGFAEIIELFASGITSHGENAIIFILLAAIATAIFSSGINSSSYLKMCIHWIIFQLSSPFRMSFWSE